jgi:hypothetical protein
MGWNSKGCNIAHGEKNYSNYIMDSLIIAVINSDSNEGV